MRSLTRNPRSVLSAIAVLLITATPVFAQNPSQYFPITPCRIFSSFDPPGTPLVHDHTGATPDRTITVKGECGIPIDATALSYNVTIVLPDAPGFITLCPSNAVRPVVSSLNFSAGDVRGNGGVVPLGPALSDDLAIHLATAPVDQTSGVILDGTGYFKEQAP